MCCKALSMPVTCTVCGEAGFGTLMTSSAAWIRGTLIEHTDPKVCARNLKRKLDVANKALKEAHKCLESSAEVMTKVAEALEKARRDKTLDE